MEEYLVAFPEVYALVANTICDWQVLLLYPCQRALVVDAHVGIPAPGGGGEEVHVLVGPGVGDEGDDAAVVPAGNLQPRLFLHLTQHALVGALVGLALAADAYPLAVAGVVLFLHAMQHQIAVAVVDVAKCRLFHGTKKAAKLRPRLFCVKCLVLGVDDGFVHSIPASGGDTPVVGGVLVAVDADLSPLHFFVSIDTHGLYYFIVYNPVCQFVTAIIPITNARQRY